MVIKKQNGFTVVELLVVIIVIGLLAAITIVSYNGVQTRSKGTQLATGLENVDQAFHTLAAEQQRGVWWRDTGATDPIYASSPANPSLANIITNTAGLDAYLKEVPASSATGTWQYDNDGDTRLTTTCAVAGSEGSDWTGIVMAVNGLSTAVIDAVDDQIDDGDILCGKVRAGNAARTILLYQLGFTQPIK